MIQAEILNAYLEGSRFERDLKRDLAKQNYLFIHKKRSKR